ncbi:MAG TPA: hypothetical protein VFT98_22300 [Myxococcota bacterium]|nr:hypothetical protein [Myxococcota bacterium]
MRPLLLALSIALLSLPALAQTPPPETITFEGIGTPVVYEPGKKVPAAARLKSISLAGGGRISFRTRDGAKYVALVTKSNLIDDVTVTTTAIVGVSKKGKIHPFRLMDIRLRKAGGAHFDGFTVNNAGVRVVDDNDTTDPDDDVLAYDNRGRIAFRVYDDDRNIFPRSGLLAAPGTSTLATIPTPYDLTVSGIPFVRLQAVGDSSSDAAVLDDLVVAWD